jgi:hypothetical protein
MNNVVCKVPGMVNENGTITYIEVRTAMDIAQLFNDPHLRDIIIEYAKGKCEEQKRLVANNVPSFPNKWNYVLNSPLPEFN